MLLTTFNIYKFHTHNGDDILKIHYITELDADHSPPSSTEVKLCCLTTPPSLLVTHTTGMTHIKTEVKNELCCTSIPLMIQWRCAQLRNGTPIYFHCDVYVYFLLDPKRSSPFLSGIWSQLIPCFIWWESSPTLLQYYFVIIWFDSCRPARLTKEIMKVTIKLLLKTGFSNTMSYSKPSCFCVFKKHYFRFRNFESLCSVFVSK